MRTERAALLALNLFLIWSSFVMGWMAFEALPDGEPYAVELNARGVPTRYEIKPANLLRFSGLFGFYVGVALLLGASATAAMLPRVAASRPDYLNVPGRGHFRRLAPDVRRRLIADVGDFLLALSASILALLLFLQWRFIGPVAAGAPAGETVVGWLAGSVAVLVLVIVVLSLFFGRRFKARVLVAELDALSTGDSKGTAADDGRERGVHQPEILVPGAVDIERAEEDGVKEPD